MTNGEIRAAFFDLYKIPSANHSEKFEAFKKAIKFEREECAKVCERLIPQDSANWIVAKGFADAIRERSSK